MSPFRWKVPDRVAPAAGPPRRRLLLALGMGALLVVAGCAGQPEPAATADPPVTAGEPGTNQGATIRIEVRYVDGLPVNGPRREVVPFGSDVEVQVSGDPPGQVHLRGYEQYTEVADAAPGVLRFTADVPGTFALEFDRRGNQLALIEVLEPSAPG